MTRRTRVRAAKAPLPVRYVETAPDARSPLVRAMELYAYTAELSNAPFKLLRHRRKLYALICLHRDPYGWTSHVLHQPRRAYQLQQDFRLDLQTTVSVMAVSLDPGAALVVDAIRFCSGGVQIGPNRYVYKNPAAPGK